MSRTLIYTDLSTGQMMQIGDDGVAKSYDGPPLSKKQTATEWLRARLAKGPVRATVISSELAQAGFSRRYIRYVAARRLNVRVFRKGGYAGAGAWFWALPKDAAPGLETMPDELPEDI